MLGLSFWLEWNPCTMMWFHSILQLNSLKLFIQFRQTLQSHVTSWPLNRLRFSQTKLFIFKENSFLNKHVTKKKKEKRKKGTTAAVLYPFAQIFFQKGMKSNIIVILSVFDNHSISFRNGNKHLHELTSTKNAISFCYFWRPKRERRKSKKRRRRTKSPEIFAIYRLLLLFINAKICFTTAFTLSTDSVSSDIYIVGRFFFFYSVCCSCCSCPHLKKFNFFQFSCLLSACLLRILSPFLQNHTTFFVSFSLFLYRKHVVVVHGLYDKRSNCRCFHRTASATRMRKRVHC